MRIEAKKLAKRIGCTPQTLDIYICGIPKIQKVQSPIDRRIKEYINVRQADIERLKTLINQAKKRTRYGKEKK